MNNDKTVYRQIINELCYDTCNYKSYSKHCWVVETALCERDNYKIM